MRKEGIKTYDLADLNGKKLIVATYLNPSLGMGEGDAYKAVVTVGLDRDTAIYYVLRAFIRKTSLEGALFAALEQCREWCCQILGIEDSYFIRFVLREIKELAQKQNLKISKIEVPAKALSVENQIAKLALITTQIRFLSDNYDQSLLASQLEFSSARSDPGGLIALERAISLTSNIVD